VKKKKKNKLDFALEKAVKVIEKHFAAPAPTIDDAKQILRDLRRMATKPSRSRANPKASGSRRKASRRLKRK
jgi:hypothetical protein